MKIPGLWLIPARAGKTPTSSPRLSASPAHPRACGENRATQYRMRANAGSSPRVRGKRLASGDLRQVLRLIPARAGKTSGGWSSPCAWSAHPRACGENSPHYFHKAPAAGSSPRVRGKRASRRSLVNLRGLIPARAGKTPTPSTPSWPGPAHPRACGENPATRTMLAMLAGSSPRVRGKQQGLQGALHRARLIPARAGKTSGDSSPARAAWAHPRACGENLVDIADIRFPQGSSPRVRGKPHRRRPRRQAGRLIPARAGKTSARSGTRATRRAHPRACGENKLHAEVANILLGSSPRVRGKPHQLDQMARDPGLIPARAGKTAGGGSPGSSRPGSSPRVRGKPHRPGRRPRRNRLIPARAGKTLISGGPRGAVPAHPRACGENRASEAASMVPGGSSPRVRGKRPLVARDGPVRGLIPARAGKTPGCGGAIVEGWAHPRACGENGRAQEDGEFRAGSSPRVRGKLDELFELDQGQGLIPARAGKT